MQQGQALERIGHAIEYLVDSRLHMIHEPVNRGDEDAVRLLSQLSREIFQGCEEVISLRQRVKNWISGRRPLTVAESKLTPGTNLHAENQMTHTNLAKRER
jgi:hypothetical protein